MQAPCVIPISRCLNSAGSLWVISSPRQKSERSEQCKRAHVRASDDGRCPNEPDHVGTVRCVEHGTEEGSFEQPTFLLESLSVLDVQAHLVHAHILQASAHRRRGGAP